MHFSASTNVVSRTLPKRRGKKRKNEVNFENLSSGNIHLPQHVDFLSDTVDSETDIYNF